MIATALNPSRMEILALPDIGSFAQVGHEEGLSYSDGSRDWPRWVWIGWPGCRDRIADQGPLGQRMGCGACHGSGSCKGAIRRDL
ncbi:MAG TPA: hypothetical protein PL002_14060, partial [Flavobacteriales bacterium]|nr:hypothetical protein [Flavobacteriales bacterium]